MVGELHIVTVEGREVCIRVVGCWEVVALELNCREWEQVLLISWFTIAPRAVRMAKLLTWEEVTQHTPHLK